MRYLLVFIVLSFFACKKSSSEPPANNNEFKATVLLSSGNNIFINATGDKAAMGCSSLGGGSFVSGKNNSNALVACNAGVGQCITAPGTYLFSCTYYSNHASGTAPIYTSNYNSGSITFTILTNNRMEGYFNSVAKYNGDSVIVTGTFKGDY